MNRMLIQDAEMFGAKFPDAYKFIIEANLRWKCFSLLARKRTGGQRIEDPFELASLTGPDEDGILCSAIREPWFVHLLETNKLDTSWV